MSAPRAHHHRPSPCRLGKGGIKARSKDEPREPGPSREICRNRRPVLRLWLGQRQRPPGGGASRLRSQAAAVAEVATGGGARSLLLTNPGWAASSSLRLLPAHQLPPSFTPTPAPAPAGRRQARGALRGLPRRREVGRRAKCGAGGLSVGSLVAPSPGPKPLPSPRLSRPFASRLGPRAEGSLALLHGHSG